MEASQTPRARVALIGASNLVLGRAIALEQARRALAGPSEIFVAAGHGRSYGLQARFLTRRLPALVDCGLLHELARGEAPLHALVADIGNDIAFGVATARIAEWVEQVVERLARHGARTTVVGLPLEPLRRLAPWQFRAFASVVFPFHGIERKRALAAAEELHGRLDALAARHGAARVDPRPEWYGFDPIHVRASARREAWRVYTDTWRCGERHAGELATLRGRAWYAQVRVLGRARGVAQPSMRAADGTTVAFY